MKIKKLLNYFNLTEKLIWSISVIVIIVSFFLFENDGYLTLVASLIGVTSLIFCAKGNPFGQFLMIIFAIIYSIISFSFQYYGEMLTYLGMSLPMAVFSLISWLKNPFNENKSEVRVNKITRKEVAFMSGLTLVVTVAFYFILEYFNTANLIPSTFSVSTSFLAAYLTFRRSPYFALAYASNDIVLIVLWVLASLKDISYISVVICFIVFLVNDLYGFISWLRMMKRQEKAIKSLLKY
ncbi:MAG: nicotinamide mononucleotide transporter [Ruminococcaceae bacterium]|nr:nicotinamide mononucleotide transporter [Oscillospiraceae bacterium]